MEHCAQETENGTTGFRSQISLKRYSQEQLIIDVHLVFVNKETKKETRKDKNRGRK